MFQLTTIEAS